MESSDLPSRWYEEIFQSLPVIAQNGPPPSLPEPLSRKDETALSIGFVAILVVTALANLIFCLPQRSSVFSESESANVSQTQHLKEGRVDTLALTGLRGFAALHVAVGHYCSVSPLHLDLIGGASMSFFYLLSGFVMTLGYAKDLVAGDGNTNLRDFNKRRFWRNRFARLFPMYMLTNILFFAVLHYGFKGKPMVGMLSSTNFDFNLILTFLGLNMWIYPIDAWLPFDRDCCYHSVALPANFVTWTVQTMAVFYIVFPYMLPWLKAVKKRRLMIHLLFWLQAVTFLSIVMIGTFGANNFSVAYWTARAWPLSRIPVFAMGCLSAVERMHGGGHVTCRFRSTGGSEARRWGWRASILGLCYILLLVAGVVINRVPVKNAKIGAYRDPMVRAFLEALVPLLFIDLILALTHCGENGILARLCRSKPMEWMGDIAMSFYMVHFSVILVVSMCLPHSFQSLTYWVVLGSFALAIFIGWFLTKFFEDPCRKCLRA